MDAMDVEKLVLDRVADGIVVLQKHARSVEARMELPTLFLGLKIP